MQKLKKIQANNEMIITFLKIQNNKNTSNFYNAFNLFQNLIVHCLKLWSYPETGHMLWIFHFGKLDATSGIPKALKWILSALFPQMPHGCLVQKLKGKVNKEIERNKKNI